MCVCACLEEDMLSVFMSIASVYHSVTGQMPEVFRLYLCAEIVYLSVFNFLTNLDPNCKINLSDKHFCSLEGIW